MKVAVLTLGCRVNQSESSVIEGTLKENGVTIVGLSENPDYCIINTCTVTAKSDYNSRQLIRRAARSGAKVIVTGCYSQLKPEMVKAIPGVTEIVDISKKFDIAGLISGGPKDPSFRYHDRSRPHLKVQDGCNFRCSYCSVPLARGRSRSIPVEEVLRRAHMIVSGGYKEIVLTGIHLGTYGQDLPERTNLNNLIKQLILKTNIYRIRLSSLEINEVDDELIELLQEDRVCKHLHLPLQSGSDRILRRMKRNYSPDLYAKKVCEITSHIDNINLGSDVIVGFPGERDAEYQETFNLLTHLPFSYLHIFPFSPRPDTEASAMSNRPDRQTMVRRIDELQALNVDRRTRYMTRQLGTRLDVILEDEPDVGRVVGTSGNYIKVGLFLSKYQRGDVVAVMPERILNGMIEATLVR